MRARPVVITLYEEGPVHTVSPIQIPPARPLPSVGAAALYLAAIAAVVALGAPHVGEVMIPLLALSLAAGLLVARWPWVALPVAFFSVLELTAWDYSFDEIAGASAAGAIVAGLIIRGAVQPSETVQASASTVRRHQSAHPARLIRRFVSREALDERIDLLRLRLDSYPTGRYQPIAALPGRTVKRAEGSQTRWREMLPLVRELGVRTAVDIGANEGYFSIQLGSSGVTTVALEAAATNQRTALLAVRRSGLDNVGVLAFEVREDTVEMVPAADSTVFLSLWHHLVRGDGLEGATAITKRLWEKTARVMFFDTGEDEMPESFGLPAMTPDPRSWLESYLTETCPGSEIRHLGRHGAFDADGSPCRRNLFAVVRV
jgi:hypothetical protein